MSDVAFVPVHVRARTGEAWQVESIPVRAKGPLEPFFAQSVERWLTRPASLLFRRLEAEDALIARTERSNVRVAGLVMHTSHCGSTLVAQALALREATVVLSEPGTLDVALAGPRFGDSPERSAAFVRALVVAQAAPFLPDGGDVVLKPEATHIASLPILRRAFPEARWIFLHRDLDAVLDANTREVGGALLPGRTDPAAFGLPRDLAYSAPLETYTARLLAAIADKALELDATDPALFVDYDTLSVDRLDAIARHFDIPLDDAARARIEARLDLEAKDATSPFVRRPAPPSPPADVRALFERVRSALAARTSRG